MDSPLPPATLHIWHSSPAEVRAVEILGATPLKTHSKYSMHPG